MTLQPYKKLQDTHKLPPFEEMDSIFGIGSIEEKQLNLREIRKRMTEKFELFCDVLRPLLQPDANFWEMTESSSFTEDEKIQLFVIYKKMMVLSKSSLLLEIKSSEKEEVACISTLFSEWKELAPKLAKMVEKTKNSWASTTEYDVIQDYLG